MKLLPLQEVKNRAVKQALTKTRRKASKQGYITEDEIFDISESFSLGLKETELLMGTLLDEGFVVLEKKPNLHPSKKVQDSNYDKSQLDYNKIFDEVIFIEPTLSEYIEIIKSIPAPQQGEEAMLIPKAKQGNAYARTRIILMFLKIVVREALYFHKSTNYPIDDSIQEGNCGLIMAIEKFEMRPDHRFSSYAPLWIRQRMNRAFGNFSRTIRLPIHTQEQLEEIIEIQADFEFRFNRKATVREILLEAEDILPKNIKKKILLADGKVRLLTDGQYTKLQKTEKRIRHLLLISKPTLSLDYLFDELGDIDYVDKNVVDPMDVTTMKLFKEQIQVALSVLSDRERQVLELRYGLIDENDHTLEEVSRYFNVTRERIRQIEAKAFRKLRHPTRSHQLREYL